MGKFIESNLYDWQEHIANKNRNFNLDRFMNNKYNTTGAVILVTPLQVIRSECFARNFNFSNDYAHADTMKAIYSALQEEDVKVNGDEIYTGLFTEDNNIRIRLCSSFSINVIYIPDVIEESQYNYLVCLNNEIKSIYNKNKDYFDKNPMLFSSNVVEESFENNIDKIVQLAHDRIGSFDYLDEYLIGSNISLITVNSRGRH